MRYLRYFPVSSVFAAIICAALLNGCTYTVTPVATPPLPATEPDLFGISVIVVNGEKDNTPRAVLTDTKAKSGFITNRQAWCQRAVERLAAELSRRGARVQAGAFMISLSLPEITFLEKRDLYEFKTTIKVALTGWSKEYSGSGSIQATSVVFPSQEANRVVARALSDTVKSILDDHAFVDQLKKR